MKEQRKGFNNRPVETIHIIKNFKIIETIEMTGYEAVKYINSKYGERSIDVFTRNKAYLKDGVETGGKKGMTIQIATKNLDEDAMSD